MQSCNVNWIDNSKSCIMTKKRKTSGTTNEQKCCDNHKHFTSTDQTLVFFKLKENSIVTDTEIIVNNSLYIQRINNDILIADHTFNYTIQVSRVISIPFVKEKFCVLCFQTFGDLQFFQNQMTRLNINIQTLSSPLTFQFRENKFEMNDFKTFDEVYKNEIKNVLFLISQGLETENSDIAIVANDIRFDLHIFSKIVTQMIFNDLSSFDDEKLRNNDVLNIPALQRRYARHLTLIQEQKKSHATSSVSPNLKCAEQFHQEYVTFRNEFEDFEKKINEMSEIIGTENILTDIYDSIIRILCECNIMTGAQILTQALTEENETKSRLEKLSKLFTTATIGYINRISLISGNQQRLDVLERMTLFHEVMETKYAKTVGFDVCELKQCHNVENGFKIVKVRDKHMIELVEKNRINNFCIKQFVICILKIMKCFLHIRCSKKCIIDRDF